MLHTVLELWHLLNTICTHISAGHFYKEKKIVLRYSTYLEEPVKV